MKPPAEPTFGHIGLPDTNLHYMKVGSGPPLVIVPATVSLIRQWESLAQFMGERYTTYFFELPGHGESSPYSEAFKSNKVPKTVAAFMNAMGHETFNLMGFSFGGLLAMRTLETLQNRIENVFLLAPCVSKQALLFSAIKQWGLKRVCATLKSPKVQERLIQVMHCRRFDRMLCKIISKMGNINEQILKTRDALRIPRSTLDVLAYTIEEIFSVEYAYPAKPFEHKCFFGMSLYDDLLDYDTTLGVVQDHFKDLTVHSFTLPYHQPPKTPTFEWLMDEFGSFLALLPS
ncbi:MAG: alpha/beta hydrolase [Chloroflexi bacterium]|nr:alpha/beta hydrolase [Chloroflexota bacterium]